MRSLSPVLLFAALAVVYATGSVLDLMEVDAAQYGTIAQDLARGGDPLRFHYRGEDYLDKPPLLFWLSALSFKLFGVHDWSYKLPSILGAILALYATYRLTRLYHGRDTGLRAALMLGSSLAVVLMTNDVRCDTLLMAAVITATWCGAEYLERPRWSWLVWTAVALACGMLAKGPMGLMAPLLALGGHIILTGRWSALRDVRLLAALPIMALLLLPMCIGLYDQFGLHGLRFFFWEQSFGRITGENVWRDDSTPFFFLHELPWQVLPWTLFVLVGVFQEVRSLFTMDRSARAERIALPGALLVFLALSASQFKLPHYLYVVHPLFCIIGAKAWPVAPGAWMLRAQVVVLVLLAVVGGGVMVWSFPAPAAWGLVALAGAVVIAIVRGGMDPERVFKGSVLVMVVLALLLNVQFYPALLRYQANAAAGRWLREQGVPPERFLAVGVGGTALDHYYGHPVRYAPHAYELGPVIAPGLVVYTDRNGRDTLLRMGLGPRSTQVFDDYRVQLLSLRFLDPATREAALDQRYLLVY